MILVPFPCRYYLFSGWQHVGKPITNQYPGAWSWVIIHLFKTSKEWGGQLSVSCVKLQGKDSLSALKTSQMWHEEQLTKGKEGGEESEMSKQKTAVVPILHSKPKNCTQDDNCQGDEACTRMQRDFTQDLWDQDLFLKIDLLGFLLILCSGFFFPWDRWGVGHFCF